MLKIPFLTDLDSRAAVKGSRDPLGCQQVWTRMGRHVIGNLTTVSNSVRDFTTLLLGYYFAERLCDEMGPDSELATFLKWEQLAAYSRAKVNNDFAFRGTERVKRNLNDGGKVLLSDDRSHQILANQKIYGLWGLYTMPSRASGLVDGSPARLNPSAMEFVERHCMPILSKHGAGKNGSRIAQMLKAKSTRLQLTSHLDPAVEAVGRVLNQRIRAAEREFFHEHLVEGGPKDATNGRQRQLATLLTETLADPSFTWSPACVTELAKRAYGRGEEWKPLSLDLHRICVTESVLAPASILFDYLLGSDGKTITSVANAVREHWQGGLVSFDEDELAELGSEWGGGDASTGGRWVGIGTAFMQHDYVQAIELLIEQNTSVMAARGGAAWVEENCGKLVVRFADENGRLPLREEMEELWRFPYFLDSLRGVTATLTKGGSHG